MAKRRVNLSRYVVWEPAAVRALRHYLGWTQLELADELGTQHFNVSDWERGKSKVTGIASVSLTRLATAHGFWKETDIKLDTLSSYPLPNPTLLQIADR